MDTTATARAKAQAQTVLDHLRERAEAAGVGDHCGVLSGRVEDAPIAAVMCLADQCSADYSGLFSAR